MSVTAEQVRDAMIAAGIETVDHHECSLCGYMTHYFRDGDALYFDPGCGCIYGNGAEPRSWQSAADWINMQSTPEGRARVAGWFGLTEQP